MKKQRLIISCFALAASIAFVSGCSMTQKGLLGGAALGAGTGAIIGHNSSAGAGKGALIGGAVGAIAGALTGDAVEKARERKLRNPPRDPYYYRRPVPTRPVYYPEIIR